MSADVEIDAWLGQLGFQSSLARGEARAVLEQAGLTRAGRQRLSHEKLERAQTQLNTTFFLHCASAECAAVAARSGKTPCLGEPRTVCEHCHGSDNARAVRELIELSRMSRRLRLVIVGGSPTTRHELEQLLAAQLEVRLIDGTKARTIEQARGDVQWADCVVLWGGTELHHKVSNQYQDSTGARGKVVQVPKRGIAQLLAGVIERLRRSRASGER